MISTYIIHHFFQQCHIITKLDFQWLLTIKKQVQHESHYGTVTKGGSVQSDAKILKVLHCLTGIYIPSVSNCD